MSTANQAKNAARSATNQARPWVVFLARFGYVSKGIVYFVIGLLAFRAAFGSGKQNVQPKDALMSIVTQPFGRILLWIVAIGLLGYILWNLVRAVMDPDREGTSAKGLVVRGSYIVSAIGYATIAATAFQILMSSRSQGGAGSIKDWTAKVMAMPFGRIAIGVVGLAIIGAGIYTFVRVVKTDFMKEFQLGRLDKSQKDLIKRLGQIGLAAKGIIYIVTGGFLAQAALTYNSSKAGGLGEAFQALARQPYGPWLLGFVAIGFMAYGVYSILQGRYRRIYVPAV